VSDALVHRADDDRIAVITLDSPANRNALSRALVAELGDQLAQAGADESLHGILLRSSHPVFCAGADLKEAATVDMVEAARNIVALQRAIVAAPVPVVCRLDGPVRAGGLVASSDLVVCVDTVTVALTEVRLGLAAAVISIPLRARLSPRAASDWFLTGRSVTAAEARDQGLVTHVATTDEMDAVVAGVLDDLRSGARQGLVEAKRLLTADLLADFDARGDEMARLSGLLFHSAVAQERMAAALRR
jgi:enoyl-CoA hydratase/carnithine racemase